MDNYYPIEFDEGGSFEIINSGTAPAPCVITFVPLVDFMTVKITGLSEEPIVVNMVPRNQALVIDGEARQVKLNDTDYFDHYDGWEFPKVQPGVNRVNIVNGSMANVSVEYTLRYI